MRLLERDRVLVLAHLKLEKPPKEVEKLTGVKYSRVLKLKKELIEAEERNTLSDLFNMDAVTLEALFETINSGMSEITDLINGEVKEGEILGALANGISGLEALNTDLQDTAMALAKQIKVHAMLTNEPSTLVTLCEALASLQIAFNQKGTNILVQPNAPDGGFVKYLED